MDEQTADRGDAAPDVSTIDDLAAELARVVTSPGYLSMVEDYRRGDPQAQLESVWEVATLENVRARAVPVTETFRVSPRVFEEGGDEPVVALKDGRLSVACDGRIVTVTERPE